MIRPLDALLLAYTKLRTHRIRTGITVGVAGILFGVLFGGIFVAQGIFGSIAKFSEEGLANRSILQVAKWDASGFDPFENQDNPDFVAKVKAAHAERVTKKKSAAIKYDVEYDEKDEDPSPIEVNKETGKERIRDDALFGEIVNEIAQQETKAAAKPFDIATFTKKYQTATVLRGNSVVQPTDGVITPMEDGKEATQGDWRNVRGVQSNGTEEAVRLQVFNDSITRPFVMTDGLVPEGELPGIVSYSQAEKLLGLKRLPKDSSDQEKLARLQEVRDRISEVTASFCYRNSASQNLLTRALDQKEELEENKKVPNYERPPVIYTLPPEGSCGAVTIAKDTRSIEQKERDDRMIAYQKEVRQYEGEPQQHKVVLRAIGLSGDSFGSTMMGGAGEMVAGLLGSWLSHGQSWSIPVGMLRNEPESLRPSSLFSIADSENMGTTNEFMTTYEYLVEFSDKDEARDALQRAGGVLGGDMSGSDIVVVPFGSGTLVVDELRHWFMVILLWTFTIIGGVALIILASLIGRTVSDGRRESAVFRAIGARRGDIVSIYGMYTLLLAARVVVFALVLGAVLALAVELLFAGDATLGARLAYAASDTSKTFHLFSVWSWYVPIIMVAITFVALLASALPIALGARRSPIRDMRNDT